MSDFKAKISQSGMLKGSTNSQHEIIASKVEVNTAGINLGDLSDVTITSPTDGSYVVYQSSSNTFLDDQTIVKTGTGITLTGNLVATGDIDVDGTLEADAITVNGITLAETISDTVGAMVGSNTESGIAVTYDDSDNTLDFNVDDFNIALTGDVTGSGTVTNLGNVSFATTIQAGSLENDMLAGSIANAKLSNSTVSYGGISLALGANDDTPAFNLQDATNLPTSALTGDMPNARIVVGNVTQHQSSLSVATTQLTGTITNTQLAGSIANDKLSNSTVNFGGVSVALGASDTTPAFDLQHATNLPTSALTGDMPNARIIAANVTQHQAALSVATSQLSGNITNAQLANSSITVSDGSNTSPVALGGTLSFTGTSNEVTVAENAGTVTIGLPDDVTITGDLSVADAPTAGAHVTNKTYVDAKVAALVDSAPEALDTLNELAAALGDDASYATTTATSLGNRLRIDVNNQSLTATQKSNASTNLGLGTAATTAATAYAPAAGSTDITTVGTIGTGTWQGTAIVDTYISSASTWNDKQDALTFGKASGNTLKSEEALVTNDVLLMGSANVKGRTYSEFKTDISLNNVENTAISTFAGTTNITTVGTIGTGTWQGTAIANDYIGDHSAAKLTSGTISNSRLPAAATNITSVGSLTNLNIQPSVGTPGGITLTSRGGSATFLLAGVGSVGDAGYVAKGNFTVLNAANAVITSDAISLVGPTAVNGALTVNSDLLKVVSTDTGAVENPILALYRNSSSIATSDELGAIEFRGNDANGAEHLYGRIYSEISLIGDGAEQGNLNFAVGAAGGLEDPVMRLRQYALEMGPGNDIYLSTTGTLIFEGASPATAHETTLYVVNPTADRTILLPDAAGTIVLKDSTDTLTNKSIVATQLTGTIDNARLPAAATSITSVGTLSGLTTGATTVNGALTVNSDLLEITSTVNDATEKPIISLYRDAGVPSTNDELGAIRWFGQNASDEKQFYGGIYAQADVITDGAHKGSLNFHLADGSNNGTAISDVLVDINGDEDPTMSLTSELLTVKANVLIKAFASGGVNTTPTPILELFQEDYPQGDDGDHLGEIQFTANNSNGYTPTKHKYAGMHAEIIDESNGTEDGSLHFTAVTAGTEDTTVLTLNGTESTFNSPVKVAVGPVTILSSNTNADLVITNGEASSSNASPIIQMYRSHGSSGAADGDDLGKLEFYGANSRGLSSGGPEKTLFASMFTEVVDSSDGTEDGQIRFTAIDGGSNTDVLTLNGSGSTFHSDIVAPLTIRSSNTNADLIISNGTDSAAASPIIKLIRTAGSTGHAAGEDLGKIEFHGNNNRGLSSGGPEEKLFGSMFAEVVDQSQQNEDGQIKFTAMKGGSNVDVLTLNGSGSTLNSQLSTNNKVNFTASGYAENLTSSIEADNTGSSASWIRTTKEFSVNSKDNTPNDIWMAKNGTRLYVTGSQNDDLHQYDIPSSDAFDVSAAVFSKTSEGGFGGAPQGIWFNEAGTLLIMVDGGSDSLRSFTLSTPYEIDTRSGGAIVTRDFTDAVDINPTGVAFNANGTKVIMVGSGGIGGDGDIIYSYNLSSAYDISGIGVSAGTTAVAPDAKVLFSTLVEDQGITSTTGVRDPITLVQSISFTPDGKTVHIACKDRDGIVSFRLGTAFDITTMTYNGALDLSYEETSVTGVFTDYTNNVGLIIGQTLDKVLQYTINNDAVMVDSKSTQFKGKVNIHDDTVIEGNALITGKFQARASATFSTLISSGNINFTSGGTATTIKLGSTTGGGDIDIGRSTQTQTINIGTGTVASSMTKTINIGTSNSSGSTTNINIGPTNTSATRAIDINGNLTVDGTAQFDHMATFKSDASGAGTYDQVISFQAKTGSSTHGEAARIAVLGASNSPSRMIIGMDNAALTFFDGFGVKYVQPANSDTGLVTDALCDLGAASGRFALGRFASGTTTASDRNEKRDIEELNAAELRVAVRCKPLLRKYRRIDAYEEKGEAARIHFGIMAQDLDDAFTAEGLDAHRYAMFMEDTWYEYEPGTVAYPTLEDMPEEHRANAIEVTKLGVRYEQLLAFIIAAL